MRNFTTFILRNYATTNKLLRNQSQSTIQGWKPNFNGFKIDPL
jgi:hypothetical protein